MRKGSSSTRRIRTRSSGGPEELIEIPSILDLPKSNAGGSKKRKRKETSKPKQPPKKKRKKAGKKSRGLRYFSKKVCDWVKKKKKTSYNEVANELVKEFFKEHVRNEETQDEKNIRRRVYDALNVLLALDIIVKNKKEISWKGYPDSYYKEENSLIRQKENLNKAIIEKKSQLLQLEKQKIALQNLFERNEKPEFKQVNDHSKVNLPFIVIHTDKNTVIECQMDQEATECFFNFSQPFEIHDDNEILQRVFEKEVQLKTQEIMEEVNKDVVVENDDSNVSNVSVVIPKIDEKDV